MTSQLLWRLTWRVTGTRCSNPAWTTKLDTKGKKREDTGMKGDRPQETAVWNDPETLPLGGAGEGVEPEDPFQQGRFWEA